MIWHIDPFPLQTPTWSRQKGKLSCTEGCTVGKRHPVYSKREERQHHWIQRILPHGWPKTGPKSTRELLAMRWMRLYSCCAMHQHVYSVPRRVLRKRRKREVLCSADVQRLLLRNRRGDYCRTESTYKHHNKNLNASNTGCTNIESLLTEWQWFDHRKVGMMETFLWVQWINSRANTRVLLSRCPKGGYHDSGRLLNESWEAAYRWRLIFPSWKNNFQGNQEIAWEWAVGV